MTDDIVSEIREGLPREAIRRDEYTAMAFRMIPPVEAPTILDIGCGSGIPTVALARLSGGRVTGIDVHEPDLEELRRRAEREGLSHHVTALNCSMLEMTFPDGAFDIVWSEGAIHVVGFERGLMSWRRLIGPGGHLVVHDAAWLRPDPPREIMGVLREGFRGIRSVPDSVEIIRRCGYDLAGHFTLPEDAWWVEYFGPLDARLRELRAKYSGDPRALAVIEREQREVDAYKRYSTWYGSAFFVMRAG
jgi:SAM-dependent methyltransferase